MAASITTFANLTNPTLPELDGNFTAIGALTPIPCTVSGTNSLVLTPNANTPTLQALAAYTQFSGVVAVTNTGATQINAAGFGLLNSYRDTPAGPIQLTGGELVAGNAFTAMYDPALNSNAGGFHVFTGTSDVLSTVSSITWSVVAASSFRLSSIALTGAAVGDPVVLGLPAGISTLASVCMFNAMVLAAGTVGIMAMAGAGSVTPTAGNYRVAVLKLS